LQVEYGITPSGETPVAAWQINQDVTLVSEDFRRKGAVPFDVASNCMLGHRKTRRFAEDQTQRKPFNSAGPAAPSVPGLRFGRLATKMDGLFSMNERYIKWYTPWLSREFEMIVFGKGGGLPLVLFPTSFGRYYQNKDFGLVGSMSGFLSVL